MLRSLFAACCFALLSTPVFADVRVVRIPKDGQVPDVVFDAKGVLHVSYGDGLPGDGYYAQSKDGGQTFSRPVRLNRNTRTVTTGMERGPKIAVGKDGVIHIVWLGHYKQGGGAWYTRSTDGGKSFEAERRLNQPDYGLDNATVTADEQGNVIVLWTGGFPGTKEDPASPAASPIILVRSTDNGKSFSKNELVKSDHPASGRACGCCRLEARIVGDKLCVAFRAGYKNLRDPYFLEGPKGENKFTCTCISADNWEFGCPMQGPSLEVTDKGRLLVSWMSEDRAYFAMSDGAGKFAKMTSPAAKHKHAFPTALQNRDGDILLMWREAGDIVYALYNAKGEEVGKHGRTRVPGHHRPTGFVDGKGAFVIVY